METITIKDFKGVNLKEGLWDQGFAGFACGIDIYGLGDDYTTVSAGKISEEGVIQSALQLSSMPGSSIMVSAMADMVFYDNNNHVYGMDTAPTATIYKWNQATPAWTADHTVAGSQGRNLGVFNNILYYTNGTQLGKYDGAIYTDNWQTGLTAANPMPILVFGQYMYVANGRYIDRWDGTTYQKQKVQLPADYTIRSMAVYRDGIYISADNQQFSRIFIWDGSSPLFNDTIPFPQEQYAPTLQAAQGFLWIVANRGSGSDTNYSTALAPIYIIQYGAPELLFELPLYRRTSFIPPSGTAVYQNGILISTDAQVNSVDDSYQAGAWYIGKDLATGLFHATQMFPVGFSQNVGAIFSSGITQDTAMTKGPAMYISFGSSGIYQVGQAGSMSNISHPIAATIIWQSLPIDAGSTKRKCWTGLRLNFDVLPTNTTVIVSYRKDDANNFTRLKIFGNASDLPTDRFMTLHLGVISRTITIRVQISETPPAPTPRIHSITLEYEPTGEA